MYRRLFPDVPTPITWFGFEEFKADECGSYR
jgi:hypothetical protein